MAEAVPLTVTQLHRLADVEVTRAIRYFNRKQDGLGDRFVDAVAAAREQIRQNPLAGSPYLKSCRFVKTSRFRYCLHYAYDESAGIAEIFAMAHTSRKPGYWLRRLERP